MIAISTRTRASEPLTPLTFLERSASVFPDRTAIIDGVRRWSYRDFYARTRRLASRSPGAASAAAIRSP